MTVHNSTTVAKKGKKMKENKKIALTFPRCYHINEKGKKPRKKLKQSSKKVELFKNKNGSSFEQLLV